MHIADTRSPSSDWIAHGLFDSAVDTFFPLLAFVETELEEVEMLTSEPMPLNRRERALATKLKQARQKQRKQAAMVAQGASPDPVPGVKGGLLPRTVTYETHERQQRYVLAALPRIVVPDGLARHLPAAFTERRLRVERYRNKSILGSDLGTNDSVSLDTKPRSLIQRVFQLNKRNSKLVSTFLSDTAQDQSTMLRRITDDRKIVTGLSRLLAPKNDVVRGLRKRLVELRGTGTAATEMSIYMGDVADHIITLLAHLQSADARLGDIHHSYLSAIRINNNQVSQSTDEILVVLAAITVAILSMQSILALFGTNITIPHNTLPDDLAPGEPMRFTVLACVIAGIVCIPVALTLWVRWLKRNALAKTNERRKKR